MHFNWGKNPEEHKLYNLCVLLDSETTLTHVLAPSFNKELGHEIELKYLDKNN